MGAGEREKKTGRFFVPLGLYQLGFGINQVLFQKDNQIPKLRGAFPWVRLLTIPPFLRLDSQTSLVKLLLLFHLTFIVHMLTSPAPHNNSATEGGMEGS